MPRFVILEHDHPALHWDFMLEDGPILKTWRLAEPPQAGRPVRAEPSCDHRLAYLDYEGPVSGERGIVRRWDTGTFSRVEGPDGVVVELLGQRLRGRVCIETDGTGGYRLVVDG